MAAPWERYQAQTSQAAAPWERYQAQSAQRAAPEVRTPDGRTTAPGTTEAQAARVPEGMIYNPETGGYADVALMAERQGPAQGAAANVLAGTPFVGEWADEAQGAVANAVGVNGEMVTELARQQRDQFREATPKTAAALQFGGAVAGSVPLAMAAGPAILSRAATPLGKIALAGLSGSVAGGIEGATQGAGAERRGDRYGGAQRGAAVGAGVGGLLGAAAPIVGSAAKAMVSRWKALDVRTIADQFGLSNEAARVVKQALANDDLTAASAALRRAGDDAMLADAGPATQNLLDSAQQTGGRALASSSRAISQRAGEAGTRLNRTLDDLLGTPAGRREGARNIAQRTAGARRAAYDRAYAQPIDYSTGASGQKIESVLQRVPPRVMQRAVDEANEAMIEAGVRNRQIMAQIGEDGSVTFSEMPNVRQLDEIKKALGSIGRAEVDEFGRPTAAGIRANRLAADLRNALTDAVPDYGRAVRLGGDKIAEDQAYQTGLGLLSSRTTIEDVREALRAGGVEARLAARNGLRRNIEDTLANVQRTITDPNVDAREAMKLVKDMSSRGNRAKVQAVLGPERTSRLYAELDRAEAALALRAATTRNSATAIREATQRQVADETQPGLVRRTLGEAGNPLDAGREVTRSAAGTDAASISRRQQAIFAEIADTLVNTRGPDARRALIAVRRAMAGQPLRDADVQLIQNAVGGATYGGGLEGLSQLLTAPEN